MTRLIVGVCVWCMFLLWTIGFQDIFSFPFLFSSVIFATAGLISNAIPVIANNGKMPVKGGYATKRHCIMTDETRCNWFADRFHWREITFSIGDVLLYLMLVTYWIYFIEFLIIFLT